MGKKFPDFKFFSCERLDGTYACQIFFGNRIKYGVLITDCFIDHTELLLHGDGNESGDGHADQRNDGQPCIQGEHAYKYNGSMQDDFNEQHGDEVQSVPDAVHIIFYPGHEFTGICLVKIVGRQALDVIKKAHTHICCNFGTGAVKEIFLGVLEYRTADTDCENAQQEPFEL